MSHRQARANIYVTGSTIPKQNCKDRASSCAAHILLRQLKSHVRLLTLPLRLQELMCTI